MQRLFFLFGGLETFSTSSRPVGANGDSCKRTSTADRQFAQLFFFTISTTCIVDHATLPLYYSLFPPSFRFFLRSIVVSTPLLTSTVPSLSIVSVFDRISRTLQEMLRWHCTAHTLQVAQSRM